jgi:hypothetical protein
MQTQSKKEEDARVACGEYQTQINALDLELGFNAPWMCAQSSRGKELELNKAQNIKDITCP